MAQYYTNISPRLIQDNAMHVLYPVNIYYNENATSAYNTIYNSGDNATDPVISANGTIWIDTNDGSKAGFVHMNDQMSSTYKLPEFYPCLSKFNGSDGEEHDAAQFKVFSYAAMLTPSSYKSPHFQNSSCDAPASFINSEEVDGKKFYHIDPDACLYDNIYSSYYVSFKDNKAKVTYIPSELHQKFYPLDSTAPIEMDLTASVDTMLKYLIETGVRKEIGVSKIWCKDMSISDETCGESGLDVYLMKFWPIFLSNNIDNSMCNIHENKYEYIRNVYYSNFRGNDNINITYINEPFLSSMPKMSGLPTSDWATIMMNNNSISPIETGFAYKNGTSADAELLGSYIGLCNSAVSVRKYIGRDYSYIYSKDSKWVSAPFACRAFDEPEDHEPNAEDLFKYILNSPDDSDEHHLNEYLVPNTLDTAYRKVNLQNWLEHRSDVATKAYVEWLFISTKPIKCKTVNNVVRLYNSANLINTIKWDINENNQPVMVFENIPDILLED